MHLRVQRHLFIPCTTSPFPYIANSIHKPNAFAEKDPTGAVRLLDHSLPHQPQLARFLPISLSHGYSVSVPVRTAYSHSTSVGKRYVCAALSKNH